VSLSASLRLEVGVLVRQCPDLFVAIDLICRHWFYCRGVVVRVASASAVSCCVLQLFMVHPISFLSLTDIAGIADFHLCTMCG
jgi:hypothetical protein